MADQEDEPQQERPDPNVYQPDQESDDIEIDRRIRRANERLKRMTMVGFPQINDTLGCQDTLTVEGGFDTGWAINYIDCGEQMAREGGGTGTGACCDEDGNCTITTEDDCDGDYQGDGTVCDPNPCPQPGACCIDGECSILSSDDCASGGGNYLGNGSTCDGVDCTMGVCCFDGFCDPGPYNQADCEGSGGTFLGGSTTCDPNPCPLPCCFPAFDGSGRMFSIQTRTASLTETNCSDGAGGTSCNGSYSGSRTANCVDPCTCFGHAHRISVPQPSLNCDSALSICDTGFNPFGSGPWSVASFGGAIDCLSDSCGSCASYNLTLDSDSATSRTFSFHDPLNNCGSGTMTVILSGECIGGFFPPP